MTIDSGPTPHQLAQMRARLLTELAARKRIARRARSLRFAAVAIAAVGTTAAAITVAHAITDDANTVFDCYSAADVAAEHATTGPVDDDRDRFALLPLSDRIAAAVQACETSWSAGPAGTGGGGAPVDVANPTVCTLADGRLGVFPNPARDPLDSFCEALGVTAPRP